MVVLDATIKSKERRDIVDVLVSPLNRACGGYRIKFI